MTAKNLATSNPAPSGSEKKASPSPDKPPEVAALLAKVRAALEANDPRLGIDLIGKSKLVSPWVTNAAAVCQMRAGNSRVAVDAYRGLVLSAGGLVLRGDAPNVFKTNYATALLMAGNIGGCLSVLVDMCDETDPGVVRLRAAIRQWQKGLTFWQRLNWWTGGQVNAHIELGFEPGELE